MKADIAGAVKDSMFHKIYIQRYENVRWTFILSIVINVVIISIVSCFFYYLFIITAFLVTSPRWGIVCRLFFFVTMVVTLRNYETSSSAVAERPRDASSLSVVSFECNLLLLVTSALDLPLCTNKFCSVLFSSSWSSMLAVINKIHWCVAACAANYTVDGRSCCSHFTSHRSGRYGLSNGTIFNDLERLLSPVSRSCYTLTLNIARYSSKIAIFAYPTCIRRRC